MGEKDKHFHIMRNCSSSSSRKVSIARQSFPTTQHHIFFLLNFLVVCSGFVVIFFLHRIRFYCYCLLACLSPIPWSVDSFYRLCMCVLNHFRGKFNVEHYVNFVFRILSIFSCCSSFAREIIHRNLHQCDHTNLCKRNDIFHRTIVDRQ